MYKLIATSNKEIQKREGAVFEVIFAMGRVWAQTRGSESGFRTSEVRIDVEYNGLRAVVTKNNIYVFRKEESKC